MTSKINIGAMFSTTYYSRLTPVRLYTFRSFVVNKYYDKSVGITFKEL